MTSQIISLPVSMFLNTYFHHSVSLALILVCLCWHSFSSLTSVHSQSYEGLIHQLIFSSVVSSAYWCWSRCLRLWVGWHWQASAQVVAVVVVVAEAAEELLHFEGSEVFVLVEVCDWARYWTPPRVHEVEGTAVCSWSS